MSVDIFDVFELLDKTGLEMSQLQAMLSHKGGTVDDIKKINMTSNTITLYNGEEIKI